MDAMTPPSKTVLTFRNDPDLFDLVRYADGRLGILRNGIVVGRWESEQENSCIATFAKLIGVGPAQYAGKAVPGLKPRLESPPHMNWN